jgi:hypothetical protein
MISIALGLGLPKQSMLNANGDVPVFVRYIMPTQNYIYFGNRVNAYLGVVYSLGLTDQANRIFFGKSIIGTRGVDDGFSGN